MPTPGLMFAGSRILDPEKTPDELFNRFYSEEHVPAVLATGQTRLALRYRNAGATASIPSTASTATPYLALYPVDDVDVLGSPANARFIADSRRSRVLACDDTYALLAFDIRAYEKIQTYEAAPDHHHHHHHQQGDGGAEGSRARTLMCVALEPRDGGDAELDAWYREEHLDALARLVPAYRRCTRYVRRGGERPRPRYLALHEFACAPADLPAEALRRSVETERTKRIVGAARVCESEVFELVEAQGDEGARL